MGQGIRQEVLGDGVLRLVLDNPPANALSELVLARLGEALAESGKDPAVRVIILGATGRLFCAGHDLKEMTPHRQDADRGRAYFHQLMQDCAAVMQAIVSHPKPVIAEVGGLATAAGCQLVASCDLAVASEVASFCTPGVHIGLFCSTPMVALSRNVPRKQAMEMLLTGDTIDAATARDMGLVNRVVPAADLATEAQALARQIASKSAQTVKTGKAAFYRQAEMDLAEAYAYTAQVMTENMLARDAEEGIGAFLERRDPVWHD